MLEEDRTALCGRATRTRPTARPPGPGRWPAKSSSGGARWRSAAPGSARAARKCRCRPSRRWPRPIPCGAAPSSSCWWASAPEATPAVWTAAGRRPYRSVSKSAWRFVAKTAAQLAAWQSSVRPVQVGGFDVNIGEHCLTVALGIGADGTKHALGLWEGSTENTTVCQSLLANLQSRGLRTDRSVLAMLDGSKALRAAVTAVFGRAALVQRCQVHKTRNILDHLPERQRPWVQAILRRAYQSEDVKTAVAVAPEPRPSPRTRASLRGGKCAGRARGDGDRAHARPLASPPALTGHHQRAESLISRTRHVKRNVKRWRGGQMMLRWVAAGVLEAAKGFRRLRGCADMPQLVAALRARDQRLGLGEAMEEEQVA